MEEMTSAVVAVLMTAAVPNFNGLRLTRLEDLRVSAFLVSARDRSISGLCETKVFKLDLRKVGDLANIALMPRKTNAVILTSFCQLFKWRVA